MNASGCSTYRQAQRREVNTQARTGTHVHVEIPLRQQHSGHKSASVHTPGAAGVASVAVHHAGRGVVAARAEFCMAWLQHCSTSSASQGDRVIYHMFQRTCMSTSTTITRTKCAHCEELSGKNGNCTNFFCYTCLIAENANNICFEAAPHHKRMKRDISTVSKMVVTSRR